MSPAAPLAMKNPDALANELSDLIATESRGMLRHIAASGMHVDEKTYKLGQTITRIAKESIHHVDRLSQVMEQLELSPRARTYSLDVTYQHYLRADHALALLVAEKQKQIAAYERAIEHVGDVPASSGGARAALQALLAENRDYLQQLQSAKPNT